MKIIDFVKEGNFVRFILGNDDCNDYYGDDWDDTPYEHNAGEVYDEFVTGYSDVVFPVDWTVLEPADDWTNEGNSRWCKDDMKDRLVPCIIAVPPAAYKGWRPDTFSSCVGMDNVIKYYFGDKREPFEIKEPING